ncbi:hypothetical protein [Flavobacterium sp. HSC-61S13]|nr:hypothetical protein [Flavobacterium sp. HSC-61S13]MCP1996190.1 hypothetical protein [Flavobacterium sp. HSC-61S13]
MMTLIIALIMMLLITMLIYNYVSPTGLCFDKCGMIIPNQLQLLLHNKSL